MSKLGEDGKPIYAENGKVVKGPNYRKPDIAAVLAEEVDDDNTSALTLFSTQELVFELASRFKGECSWS